MKPEATIKTLNVEKLEFDLVFNHSYVYLFILSFHTRIVIVSLLGNILKQVEFIRHVINNNFYQLESPLACTLLKHAFVCV